MSLNLVLVNVIDSTSKMTKKHPIITADKKNIEHVTIFHRKYISKGAIDEKFLPDVACK